MSGKQRWRVGGNVLAGLFLTLAACAGGGDETTDTAFVTSTSVAVSEPASPASETLVKPRPEVCVTETVEDEYGFQTEIETCDGNAVDGMEQSAPEEELTTLADLPGSNAGVALAAGIRDRLVLQTGCGGEVATENSLIGLADPAMVGAAVRAMPDETAQDDLIRAFASLTEADRACRSDPALWSERTLDAIEALDRFAVAIGAKAGPGELPSAEGTSPEELSAVSAAATNVYHRLYLSLTGRPAVQGSDLWFSASHLAHVSGLRSHVVEGGEPATLILGSSLVARGLDPTVIDDAVGDVVSFALLAATQPIHVALGGEARALAPTIDTVVWGQSSHPFFRPCVTGDAEIIDGVLARQARSFEGVAGLDELRSIDRILGVQASAGQVAGGSGDWQLGTTGALEGEDQDRRERQAKAFTAVYREPTQCQELYELVEDAIGQWVGDGVDVVVFIPPLSDEMTSFHPQGRAAHDDVIATLQEVAVKAGADFVDFSDAVADENFYDMTHVNAVGRRQLTTELADYLSNR